MGKQAGARPGRGGKSRRPADNGAGSTTAAPAEAGWVADAAFDGSQYFRDGEESYEPLPDGAEGPPLVELVSREHEAVPPPSPLVGPGLGAESLAGEVGPGGFEPLTLVDFSTPPDDAGRQEVASDEEEVYDRDEAVESEPVPSALAGGPVAPVAGPLAHDDDEGLPDDESEWAADVVEEAAVEAAAIESERARESEADAPRRAPRRTLQWEVEVSSAPDDLPPPGKGPPGSVHEREPPMDFATVTETPRTPWKSAVRDAGSAFDAAMEEGERRLQAHDHQGALASFREALGLRPDDAAAATWVEFAEGMRIREICPGAGPGSMPLLCTDREQMIAEDLDPELGLILCYVDGMTSCADLETLLPSIDRLTLYRRLGEASGRGLITFD